MNYSKSFFLKFISGEFNYNSTNLPQNYFQIKIYEYYYVGLSTYLFHFKYNTLETIGVKSHYFGEDLETFTTYL